MILMSFNQFAVLAGSLLGLLIAGIWIVSLEPSDSTNDGEKDV